MILDQEKLNMRPDDLKPRDGCPNCERLSAFVDKLIGLIDEMSKQIGQLQERVEELEKAGKRQAAPFRRPEEKRKKNKRKPGRKKGHEASYRTPPPSVDEHAEVPLECCPKCGGLVFDVRPVEQIIEDIPRIEVHRLHLTTYRGQCAECGQVHSTHPAQVSTATGAAGTHLGKRALALAAALNKHYGVTLRKTTQILGQHFGLSITPGGLSQALARMAAKLAEPFAELCRAIQSSDVIHADETSWWVEGNTAWLWTFTNPEMTLYTIGKRNYDVIERMLGKDYNGVLVSDCLNIYDRHPGRKSKCCAHHLKAISEALKQAPGNEFLLEVKAFLKAAILLHNMRGAIDDERYWHSTRHLERQADKLLLPPRSHSIEEAIANRLRKQREHLLTFLHVPGVDPTNNLAERQLRPAVIARKLSCGNKTWAGATTFGVIASIAQTCYQNSRSFSDFVAECLSIQRSPPALFAAD